MSLTKTTKVDQITITEIGVVTIRTATVIMEDGVELSRTFHRDSLEPGQDVSSQDPQVQKICQVTWTPEIIDQYSVLKASQTEENQQ